MFPLVAARMELILIEGVLVVVPFISVLTAETELMRFPGFSRGRLSRTHRPLDQHHPPENI